MTKTTLALCRVLNRDPISWTPEVSEIMECWALFTGFWEFFHIPFGSRHFEHGARLQEALS